MMSHVTVTNYHMILSQSYNYVSWWKIVEGSKRNNVITIYLTYIDLKDNI